MAFRTDSSLKKLSTRGTPSNVTHAAPSNASANGAAVGRDEIVEKARIEREKREWTRRMSSHALRIQAIMLHLFKLILRFLFVFTIIFFSHALASIYCKGCVARPTCCTSDCKQGTCWFARQA